MTEPTDSSPAQRAAHLAAFGLLYGLAALLARTVLAGPAGGLANADPSYYAGATVALPFDVLLGCVIGLPAARRPGSLGARAVSGVCAMVVLALHVAVTPRLPGAVTREHLELAGPRALGAGLMLGAALLAGLQPLAQRLTARYEKRAGRVADAVALGLLACLDVGASVGAYDALYAGAVHPLWHLALESGGRETPAADPAPARHDHDHEHHEHDHGEAHQRRIGPNDVMVLADDEPSTDGRPPGDIRVMVSVLHQGDTLEPVPDTAYPYCLDALPPPPIPAGEALPDVIVVLLRDVGMRELQLDAAPNVPVMPMLRRLGTEAVLFDDVMAAGEVDEDVLPAVLSGQPPSSEAPLLRDPALPYLPGVARDFAARGYETAFFDGVRDDRTFRGSYLRMVGFERVDAPALGAAPVREDQATYEQLAAFFDAEREHRAPRFAVMHNLGRTAESALAGPAATDFESLRARLADTDQQFEAFYTWYQREARPRGTVLLVLGDHPSPVVFPEDPETPTTGTGHELFFRVPLFVTGLTPPREAALRERSSRLGAHTDLPRTLLGLTGDHRHGCYFGRDLFADGDWPTRRAPLSFGGDSRQFLVAHDGDTRWLYNTLTRTVRIHDRARDPRLERDLFSEDDPEWPRVREYLLSHLATQNYLRRRRRYIPLPDAGDDARPPVTQPERISDRGLLDGPVVDGERPLRQSHAEVQAAADAGFEAIALDVFMTSERDLITIGSSQLFELREGLPVTTEDVTRQQLETMQRPAPTVQELLRRHPSMRFHFALHAPTRPERRGPWLTTVVQTFRELPPDRVALTLDDPVLAGVLVGELQGSGVSIGLTRAPDSNEAAQLWLQTARAIGVGWLFLPHNVVDEALMERAHGMGVKVGLLGVTGAAAVTRLMSATATPDAYLATRAFLLTGSPRPSAP
ncbi:MAG: sulfatase-like hydrolase/transferase [Polyangiales bacterium]|nr:sulfatase-like hydrolase/transferase [Myxococcales bacterium]MCB9659817.1 sulfatase-like hydrolase/transferase [Sandaracinaceae bacterium]